MKIDRALAWMFPHSFRAKLMAVVIASTTVPVSVFALWLMWNNGAPPEQLLWGTAMAIVVTLVGALAALVVVYQLLAPLRCAVDALDAYDIDQTLPQLPEAGDDDMGRLLSGLNRCLHTMHAGRRELERHALEDPLTGIMNRRGCEQALAASVARSDGIDRHFVLFVIDMDNLKPINDEHGHSAGDHALMTLVASAMECCLGADDWIGRWGGDEFLLGMHVEMGLAQDRVRAWLRALSHPADGVLPVYVSVGCAHYRPGQDPLQLYRQADKAMYQAKFSGGRRLVCHSALAAAEAAAHPRQGAA